MIGKDVLVRVQRRWEQGMGSVKTLLGCLNGDRSVLESAIKNVVSQTILSTVSIISNLFATDDITTLFTLMDSPLCEPHGPCLASSFGSSGGSEYTTFTSSPRNKQGVKGLQ